jgi:aminomethyltransferase
LCFLTEVGEIANQADGAGALETPLYSRHVALGGRMVPFAGYLMPVDYGGIVAEHLSVRQAVGMFDVSHMGEITVSGPGALAFLNLMTTNDVARLDVGQVQYTTVLNERGGVIDDLLVYRRSDDYFLVPNAANAARVWEWLTSKAGAGVKLENLSAATGQIAVQGPRAPDLVQPLCSTDLSRLGYYRFVQAEVAGVACLVSRTGYTGEDGFELYAAAGAVGGVWDRLAAGSPRPQPCGLGARDTLRLEMAFRLHGSDMDESVTPLEAGLGWVVKMDKGDFVGRSALAAQTERGVPRRLVGLKTESRRVPRPGHRVLVDHGDVGVVTSGGPSPSLGGGVALARVEAPASKASGFKIDVRGEMVDAAPVKGPFYKQASHK